MNMFLKLLYIEGKRIAVRLPGIAARAVVMVLILGILVVFGIQLDQGDKRVSPFTIGYSMEEEDRLGEFAVFYLEHMESLSGICQFLKIEPKEGQELLKQGSIAAYIRFPERFVEKIMNGTNEPVLIQLPQKLTLEAALLKDQAAAGADMLSVSQAEIYACGSLAIQYGQPELMLQMEEEINRWNMKLAMNRSELFREQVVSAVGQATALEYGVASMLVYCLFLMGIPCSSFLIASPDALTQSLLRVGLPNWQQILARVLVMAAVLVLFATVLLAGIHAGEQYGSGLSVNLGSFETWWAIVMICLCVASVLTWCCHVAPQESAAVMLIFWLSLLLLFISGGFLPSVFLPEALLTASEYLPGKWLLREMASLFSWSYMWENHVVLLLFSLLFFLLTVAWEFLYRIGRRRS